MSDPLPPNAGCEGRLKIAEEGTVVELLCPDDSCLRSLTPRDAPALFALLRADRDAFDPWLRWSAGIRTVDAAEAFIAEAARREAEGRGFHLGLRRGEALVGGVPCWSIDPTHRVAELGHWLSPAARGAGLAARATRTVMQHLFAAGGVNRVEFQCRVENAPSRRLATRVGGLFEGVRRQSHCVDGVFRDHAVYAVLAGDPPPPPPDSAGRSEEMR